jgi:photosynthetic reaction center M subunit
VELVARTADLVVTPGGQENGIHEHLNPGTGARPNYPASPARTTPGRDRKPVLLVLAGKIGNAQIGPIYLGWTGVASLFFGIIAFEIIGLNMWASVNWEPVQFVRQLPWLALEPPLPKHG